MRCGNVHKPVGPLVFPGPRLPREMMLLRIDPCTTLFLLPPSSLSLFILAILAAGQ